MSEPRRDEELRARFASLRALDARSTPGFDSVLRREDERRERRVRWLWAPALGVVAATTLLVVLWPRTESPPAASAPWTARGWAMPTDVLLDLPGTELLRDLPDIGRESDPASPPQSHRSAPERTIG